MRRSTWAYVITLTISALIVLIVVQNWCGGPSIFLIAIKPDVCRSLSSFKEMQTLLAGLIAIAAALIAANPVKKQLEVISRNVISERRIITNQIYARIGSNYNNLVNSIASCIDWRSDGYGEKEYIGGYTISFDQNGNIRNLIIAIISDLNKGWPVSADRKAAEDSRVAFTSSLSMLLGHFDVETLDDRYADSDEPYEDHEQFGEDTCFVSSNAKNSTPEKSIEAILETLKIDWDGFSKRAKSDIDHMSRRLFDIDQEIIYGPHSSKPS